MGLNSSRAKAFMDNDINVFAPSKTVISNELATHRHKLHLPNSSLNIRGTPHIQAFKRLRLEPLQVRRWGH